MEKVTSGNANYKRGVWLERKILNSLTEQGFNGMRSAGSHSPVDVVVWNLHTIYLVQCKHTVKKYIDISNLLCDDSIIELENMECPANAKKVLCIKQGCNKGIIQMVYDVTINRWKLETVFQL